MDLKTFNTIRSPLLIKKVYKFSIAIIQIAILLVSGCSESSNVSKKITVSPEKVVSRATQVADLQLQYEVNGKRSFESQSSQVGWDITIILPRDFTSILKIDWYRFVDGSRSRNVIVAQYPPIRIPVDADGNVDLSNFNSANYNLEFDDDGDDVRNIDDPNPLDPRIFIAPEMISLPSGCSQIGSSESEFGRNTDEKIHVGCVEKFSISKFEITFDQFDAFVCAEQREKIWHDYNDIDPCGLWPDDNGWGRGDRPVINIGLNDAIAYTNWLSSLTRQKYRLPTETEWEYMARAGATSAYFTGSSIDTNDANFRDDVNASISNCKSSNLNLRGKTALVGSYIPNNWGIYDIAGNVSEMTCSNYPKRSALNTLAICGGDSKTPSVVRGGSWNSNTSRLRFANRDKYLLEEQNSWSGFRVLLEE